MSFLEVKPRLVLDSLAAVCCIISEAKWPSSSSSSSSDIIGKHSLVSGPCNSAMADVVAVYTRLAQLTFESVAIPRSRACQCEWVTGAAGRAIMAARRTSRTLLLAREWKFPGVDLNPKWCLKLADSDLAQQQKMSKVFFYSGLFFIFLLFRSEYTKASVVHWWARERECRQFLRGHDWNSANQVWCHCFF